MIWKKLITNVKNIEKETEHSYLILMPENCKYAGLKFYHPKKLCKSSANGVLEVVYNDIFEFELSKEFRTDITKVEGSELEKCFSEKNFCEFKESK